MNVATEMLFRILPALDAPKSNSQITCTGRLIGPGMSLSAEKADSEDVRVEGNVAA
jgi:hypothetical protein